MAATRRTSKCCFAESSDSNFLERLEEPRVSLRSRIGLSIIGGQGPWKSQRCCYMEQMSGVKGEQ